MPTLFILGGANGVGKTTWYHYYLKTGRIDPDLPFINLDDIQKELGGYTTENALKAEAIARNKMANLIALKKDFMIESNLSSRIGAPWRRECML